MNGISSTYPIPAGMLWTIGHSTRDWNVFVDMLCETVIEHLLDVRRFAGSRRHPQYDTQTMSAALAELGVAYSHLPALGGRRTASPDSPHTAWRNAAFRGYADHMQTREYLDARDRLADAATQARAAVMCAEAMWWQCHRGLISDDFKARGWDVIHLLAPGRSEPHPYTAAARIVDGALSYRAPPEAQAELF